jgi:methionine-rich copper-binding protein CopC
MVRKDADDSRENAMRSAYGCRIFLIAALLAVLVLAGGAVSAANPPEFLASDPPSGVTVATAPEQVVLTFSKPLDGGMTGGYVHSVDGVIVSTSIKVSPDDATKVIVSLAPNLSSGWYMVMWNTALVGSDDFLTGDITFEIA